MMTCSFCSKRGLALDSSCGDIDLTAIHWTIDNVYLVPSIRGISRWSCEVGQGLCSKDGLNGCAFS